MKTFKITPKKIGTTWSDDTAIVTADTYEDAIHDHRAPGEDADLYSATQITYSVRGSVRGDCGHRHWTAAAAEKCAERDARACVALGGGAYSDRDEIVEH